MLDAFVGANYLVTLREEEIRGIDRVFAGYARRETHQTRPRYLLYQVCDAVADYLPCMDAIDEESIASRMRCSSGPRGRR
jgi:Mg2+ and Co2+ transporter CorA